MAAWSTIGDAGGDDPLPTFLPSGGSLTLDPVLRTVHV